jgi:phospholipid transport system substrate-binding protein
LLATASAASAQATDPAIPVIDNFDKALLETMKSAKDLGVNGRYHKLEPVIEQTFNLPAMTGFAVGTRWKSFNDADRQSVTDAFKRLTVSSYAHNFNGYGGEHFEIDPNVQTRGVDKIVQTKLVRPKDKPVSLNYRMRQDGATWKVIDIYYGNISQLSIRRSDLQTTAMTGGPKGLIKTMNEDADKLMK